MRSIRRFYTPGQGGTEMRLEWKGQDGLCLELQMSLLCLRKCYNSVDIGGILFSGCPCVRQRVRDQVGMSSDRQLLCSQAQR